MKTTNLEVTANNHELSKDIVQENVKLKLKKIIYDFKKRDVVKQVLKYHIKKGMTLRRLASRNLDNLEKNILQEERRKYEKMTKQGKQYVYEECPNRRTNITYLEESHLIQQLREDVSSLGCYSQVCVLEHLSNLVYKFVREKENPRYPSSWDISKFADKKWLFEFKIRHSPLFSEFSKTCEKENSSQD